MAAHDCGLCRPGSRYSRQTTRATIMNRYWIRLATTALLSIVLVLEIIRGVEAVPQAAAENLEPIDVEGQPLASNVERLIQGLEWLGTPLPLETKSALQAAGRVRDA